MHKIIFVFGSLFILAYAADAFASQDKMPGCAATDRACLAKQIELLAPQMEQQAWKDQTLRELAKTYAYDGQADKAIALIDKIQTPDTKAMTIRGIGMAAAGGKWSKSKYDTLWTNLAKEAAKIQHPPSQGIAYTYIAMSQAFAGDDMGARKTAAAMDNQALRNKAFGETAEIEADRGDLKNALISLDAVDTQDYKNKAYATVSRIFIDKGMIDEGFTCANHIDNAYLKAKSLQLILNKDNKEEADMEPVADLSKTAE